MDDTGTAVRFSLPRPDVEEVIFHRHGRDSLHARNDVRSRQRPTRELHFSHVREKKKRKNASLERIFCVVRKVPSQNRQRRKHAPRKATFRSNDGTSSENYGETYAKRYRASTNTIVARDTRITCEKSSSSRELPKISRVYVQRFYCSRSGKMGRTETSSQRMGRKWYVKVRR